jgi:hypothetical protein
VCIVIKNVHFLNCFRIICGFGMKLLYFLVAVIAPLCHCLVLYIPKDTKRCVSQELDNEDSAVFSFGREVSDMTGGSVVVSVSPVSVYCILGVIKSEKISIFYFPIFR